MGASLTFVAGYESTGSWFLTVESGQVPACAVAMTLGERRVIDGGVVLRGSFLIVQGKSHLLVNRSAAAIARLEAVTLENVRRLVVTQSDRIFRGGAAAVEALLKALGNGWCSARIGCRCSWQRTCSGCSRVGLSERVFVKQVWYDGVFPLGREHWFTGVTDGVYYAEHAERWYPCGVIVGSCMVCEFY